MDPAHVSSQLDQRYLVPALHLSKERLLWDLNIVLLPRYGQVERES